MKPYLILILANVFVLGLLAYYLIADYRRDRFNRLSDKWRAEDSLKETGRW